MSRKRWRAASTASTVFNTSSFVIFPAGQQQAAAGGGGWRGLVLILSSWELGPAPWPWIQLLWGRAANNIRKHGHREKFK